MARRIPWSTLLVLALVTTGCKARNEPVVISHSVGAYAIGAYGEEEPCIQWTLDNDQAIYVNAVTLQNDGGYHHSTWLVVPEDLFAGPDGFFDCDARGFNQVDAAVAGTALIAQSTQSRFQEQRFPEGVVVKIPPRHKLVSTSHVLNLAPREVTTELKLSLELIHPAEVKKILLPFHLDYRPLDIPPQAESRFTLKCDLEATYKAFAGGAFDMKIWYVLPHFHAMANHWSMEVMGGENDGKVLHSVDGFNADAQGAAMEPPFDMTGATGLSMTCGYLSDRDVATKWGIGDQEMCEMLGLGELSVLIDATASGGNQVVGTDGNIVMNEAPCSVIAIPPAESMGMPTTAEKEGELYVPPIDPEDADLSPTPECVDTPAAAVAEGPVTLTSIRDNIFFPSCSFNACHAGPNARAGLDLTADDLYAELMGHTSVGSGLPLVAAGDAQGSWLYQRLAECDPEGTGGTVAHMPLNAPTLLEDALVAKVRDWIDAGAPND